LSSIDLDCLLIKINDSEREICKRTSKRLYELNNIDILLYPSVATIVYAFLHGLIDREKNKESRIQLDDINLFCYMNSKVQDIIYLIKPVHDDYIERETNSEVAILLNTDEKNNELCDMANDILLMKFDINITSSDAIFTIVHAFLSQALEYKFSEKLYSKEDEFMTMKLHDIIFKFNKIKN